MRTTPMLEKFRGAGGRLAPYRGWLGWEGEAEAAPGLRLYDGSWRAVVRVAGPDARTWLNGMITANVKALAPGDAAPSFQLDPKGHILAAFEVACIGPDVFLLLSDEAQREGLVQRLRKFVFISKLTLEDESEAWGALRLRGEGAYAAAEAVGLGPRKKIGEPRIAEIVINGRTGWRLEAKPGGAKQVEILIPAAEVAGWWDKLAGAATPAGWAAQEQERILQREPLYGADITETELPQETGQAAYLNFEKGCYVGQEIVERIRARGAVHKHFRAMEFAAAVEAGTKLSDGGHEIGRITSVARRDGGAGGWLALGYVRDPHAAAGSVVRAGDVEGRVLA